MHGLMAHSWRVLRVSPREFEHYVYIVCTYLLQSQLLVHSRKASSYSCC